MGPLILLVSKDRASVGDFFVDTVVLHDPHDALLTQAPGGPAFPEFRGPGASKLITGEKRRRTRSI